MWAHTDFVVVVDTIYALLSGNMPGYDSGFRRSPQQASMSQDIFRQGW